MMYYIQLLIYYYLLAITQFYKPVEEKKCDCHADRSTIDTQVKKQLDADIKHNELPDEEYIRYDDQIYVVNLAESGILSHYPSINFHPVKNYLHLNKTLSPDLLLIASICHLYDTYGWLYVDNAILSKPLLSEYKLLRNIEDSKPSNCHVRLDNLLPMIKLNNTMISSKIQVDKIVDRYPILAQSSKFIGCCTNCNALQLNKMWMRMNRFCMSKTGECPFCDGSKFTICTCGTGIAKEGRKRCSERCILSTDVEYEDSQAILKMPTLTYTKCTTSIEDTVNTVKIIQPFSNVNKHLVF